MLAYLSALFSGNQDALRATLLGGAVLGGLAVGVGIFWESHKLTWATALVLVGIVAEAICTIFLFVIDEGISQSQQRTIEQLLTKRKLNAEQKDRIAKAVKPFPPVAFISYTNPEAEPWDFALDISAALKASGWDWKPFPPPAIGLQALDGRPSQGMKIADHIEIHAGPDMKSVADALAGAIRDPTVIGLEDVRVVIAPEGLRDVNTAEVMPNTINVIVGSKR